MNQEKIKVKINLLDGLSSFNGNFPAIMTLDQIQTFLRNKHAMFTKLHHNSYQNPSKYTFLRPGMERYNLSDPSIKGKTLKQLGFKNAETLTCVFTEKKKDLLIERNMSIQQGKLRDEAELLKSKGLRGDDIEKKERFEKALRKKQREEEASFSKQKKNIIKEVRKQVSQDKEKRKRRVWVYRESDI